MWQSYWFYLMFLSLDLSFLKCFKSIVNIIIISIDHFFCAINSRGRSAHCTLPDQIVKWATPLTALSFSFYLFICPACTPALFLFLSIYLPIDLCCEWACWLMTHMALIWKVENAFNWTASTCCSAQCCPAFWTRIGWWGVGKWGAVLGRIINTNCAITSTLNKP